MVLSLALQEYAFPLNSFGNQPISVGDSYVVSSIH
jgi:hypothetical protein